jgi:sugar phosphate isomerase/epimerase
VVRGPIRGGGLNTALSTGCFIGHEGRIAASMLDAVELSSHRPEQLPSVLEALREARTRILSIHTPCPNAGRGLDPGATAAEWGATREGLLAAGAIAREVGARYVLAHAFYCGTEGLPSGDAERMAFLRRADISQMPFADYVRSESYLAAKRRTAENLKSLLPTWRERFPEQAIILENLNPRHGYGGVVFEDVVDIARELDGEVKICLDIGHLTLAEKALGIDMTPSVEGAGELIVSVHVHQNFGGRYCVDRHHDAGEPRGELQDVDTHLPLDVPMWRSEDAKPLVVGAENAAFYGVLEGAAQYRRADGAPRLEGAVEVERLLALVPSSANLVLELDARYVPLDDVLASYQRFRISRVARA